MRRRIDISCAALTDFDVVYDLIAESNLRAAALALRDLDRVYIVRVVSDHPANGAARDCNLSGPHNSPTQVM